MEIYYLSLFSPSIHFDLPVILAVIFVPVIWAVIWAVILVETALPPSASARLLIVRYLSPESELWGFTSWPAVSFF